MDNKKRAYIVTNHAGESYRVISQFMDIKEDILYFYDDPPVDSCRFQEVAYFCKPWSFRFTGFVDDIKKDESFNPIPKSDPITRGNPCGRPE